MTGPRVPDAAGWFSVNADGDITHHATPEDAEAAAEAELSWCRDQAGDDTGWPESVSHIMWGRVCGRARLVSRQPCHDGPWDEVHEYAISPVAPPLVEGEVMVRMTREDAAETIVDISYALEDATTPEWIARLRRLRVALRAALAEQT